ncbi:hypothetical protein PV721_41925 [Streptomyces sp. MB09-01]|uniref:hypothetical protein n=1 Tax=Streptomyces sp. MB09-01 TaxID=3028666 RepID=UPI0029BDF96D|nr:hypothetical protein [Streptomyces sp. MB09-01]MDX3540736.1 hypothetical protein [Streptomyces sp. MB09-01]
MPRTSRTLRLVMLTASTSLAAGAVLLPTGAFAAPAAPHTVTFQADRGGNDHEDREDEDWNQGEDRNEDEGGSREEGSGGNEEPSTEQDGSQEEGSGEGKDASEPEDSESGVVQESYCNDPKALPGLCVDGKPLPKGDGTVKVPQGTKLCLGIDTPEQCADRQKPTVPSPTGSSTVELAV